MTDSNRSAGSSQSSSTIDQIRDYDWNTKDSSRFLDQFRTIVGRARDAGVTEQQLLDSVSQRYNAGGSGTAR